MLANGQGPKIQFPVSVAPCMPTYHLVAVPMSVTVSAPNLAADLGCAGIDLQHARGIGIGDLARPLVHGAVLRRDKKVSKSQ